MNIGVAKPSSAELSEVRHHFISTHSIHEQVNAGSFETYALDIAEKIFQKADIMVMAGGTGLYIKAFCEGMDRMPDVPVALHDEINRKYEEQGIEWLREELRENDPVYYSSGEIQNPHRMLRALEVKLASGRSIREYQTKKNAVRHFQTIRIGMDISKADLHRNIDHRVEEMMKQGLLGEVKELYEYRDLKALQTVGYTELFEYLENKCSLDQAVENIKKNTRHYAKRQMTWFRKDKDLRWFPPTDMTGILNELNSTVKRS